MKKLLLRIRIWLLRIARPDKVMYIGGSDTLPQPLTRAEEAELIARMDDGDLSVRQTLIERNLRLVVYLARRFENTGINMEDLISIGTIGLIRPSTPSARTKISSWPPMRPAASKTRSSCTCAKTPPSGRRSALMSP